MQKEKENLIFQTQPLCNNNQMKYHMGDITFSTRFCTSILIYNNQIC